MNPDNVGASELRFAFIGGGSGGHLFPAIAICHSLLELHPESRFLFLVSHRPIDVEVLANSGLPANLLRVHPYVAMAKRQGRVYQLLSLPNWVKAWQNARRVLAGFHPHVAVGVGSSASVPGMIAASHQKVRLALMEQNTVPGKATQLLSRRAKLTLAGLPFEDRFSERWRTPIEITGTPVRKEISKFAGQTDDVWASRSRLLILGGSQGSASVNRLILEALADEHCVPSDWEIIHQTGASQVKQVSAEYARRGRTALVLSFLPKLPELLATATVVVSRGGASTIQELACAGRPTILIPFSGAASNHQMANAQTLAKVGAAALVDETAEDAGLQLRFLLNMLVKDGQQRQQLRQGIRNFSRPEAAMHSARRLIQFAREN